MALNPHGSAFVIPAGLACFCRTIAVALQPLSSLIQMPGSHAADDGFVTDQLAVSVAQEITRMFVGTACAEVIHNCFQC